MTTSERAVVAALEQAICQRIGEPRYQLWFPDKTKFTWLDSELLVGVPNHFYQEWLRKQFADVVRAAAAEVAGTAVAVNFVIDPDLFQAARLHDAVDFVDELGLQEMLLGIGQPNVGKDVARTHKNIRVTHHLSPRVRFSASRSRRSTISLSALGVSRPDLDFFWMI